MHLINKLNIFFICWLTIGIMTSVGPSAIAQSRNTEEPSATPQEKVSEDNIPELRKRIKDLVRQLKAKLQSKENQEKSSVPAISDSDREVPETPQVFVTPETPQTPETSETPQTPETPQAAETSETPQTPETPQVPEAPPSASTGTPEEAKAKPAAPGQFKVDEESAQRALERTLVQSGALLLPSGQADFETSMSFARNQQSFPVLINSAGTDLLVQEELRSSTLDLALSFRLGLPFDSQIEVGVPYRYIDESAVSRSNLVEIAEKSRSGDGMGDFSLVVAKTLLHEKGPRPDLIARLSWDADNGDSDDKGVPLVGFGHNEYGASLTATKRQDPLIFTGNLSYRNAKEKHGVQPGDSIGLSIGTVLAASPETSLQLVLNQLFVNETKVDKQKIAGSDRVIGSLSIGASSVLDHRNFLNVSVDMGLTDDATDYSLNITYIRRFTGLFSSQ